jgi:two-component system chemotaxis sensor kinase CheA
MKTASTLQQDTRLQIPNLISEYESKIKELDSTINNLQIKIENLEFEQLMFHQLLSAIPDNIYFKDRKSRFTILSKAMMEWFGRKKINEVIGKTDFDMFTEEHAREAFEDEQRLMETGEAIINKEEKETWEGGKITWVSSSKVPTRSSNGEINGIVGISRDITEKKKTEMILNEYRNNLENAKRETDNILATVEEGLFLLDKDLKIGSQHSLELRSIIGDKNPANKKFIQLLDGKVNNSILNTVKDYLDLLFDENNDESMLLELNPLIEVEFKVGRRKKFLTFKFRRVNTSSGRADQVISIVSDVTKEVNLARTLKQQEAENKRKMDWLLSILNIDPTMLKEFISSVHEELDQMDESYQKLSATSKELELIDSIYRSMHTIKGGARLLEMGFFADLAHSAEDVISNLRTVKKLSDADLKKLNKQIKMMHQTYNELKELIDHIGKIHDQFRPKRSYEHKLLLNTLDRLVKSLNEECQKDVKFDYKNLDGSIIPFQRRLLIRDILVQLIRNSMYHGLESKNERKALNKSVKGNIKVSGYVTDNAYILQYEDDGRGLDSRRLLDKARKSGIWSKDEINSWSDAKIYETIFHPGISTAKEVSLTAGRGMGLNIIKKKLEKIGGEISILTEPTKYTRFEILIPIEQDN